MPRDMESQRLQYANPSMSTGNPAGHPIPAPYNAEPRYQATSQPYPQPLIGQAVAQYPNPQMFRMVVDPVHVQCTQ